MSTILYPPIATSTPLNPFSEGCKSIPKSISQSIPITRRQVQKESYAINIPSPPLTPYLGYADSDTDLFGCDNLIDNNNNTKYNDNDDYYHCQDYFSHNQTQTQQRHSTSAPTMMSPLSLRLLDETNNNNNADNNNCSRNNTKSQTRNIPPIINSNDKYGNFQKMVDTDYWKSVSTIRSTYFFDGIGRGGGFLAIPHLASHGNARTNFICRLLEDWLTLKLVEPTISDSIPVLEDSIQSSVHSIERHLKRDPKVWTGVSKAFINIRCGHVFMLDSCCDDQTIIHLGADEFYNEYPLFVDIEIKMRGEPTHRSKSKSTEVLIAFQNVVATETGSDMDRPYIHHTLISEPSL